MNFKNVIALFLLVSCSQIKMNTSTEKEKAPVKPQPLIDEVVNLKLLNGKVTYSKFTFRKPDGTYVLNCSDKRNRNLLVRDGFGQIYIGANYFAPNTNLNCSFEGQKIFNVNIGEFKYPFETLNVAKGKVDYSPAAIKRIIKEKEIKKKIYLNSADEFLFEKPFVKPLNSFVTSHYGKRRIFNNKKKSQHLGNDLRARTGVKIPAANRGKVVYVGNLFFSGNVVVIDHGMDIFTMYGHLSKILTTKGSIVNQGDIIGLAGATGRVSGPHLHWGVKVNGTWVDGFNLVEVSKEQFNSAK